MFEAAAPHKRWALPTLALLLVGSLLFGHLPPAAGVDGVVDHRARYSACVGAATASAGFMDMAGSFAEEAANCLAHYGITYGTAPGVFSPSDIIPRWQMALFLQRAAGPAGIVIPKASDQGFTDLGAFAAHIRSGINQMAALGIMPGISGSTYGPTEPVTRQEMASLLARFLMAAPTGPGGVDISKVTPDDSNFTDLGEVLITTYRDIRLIYEMGVTSGTSATTFAPDGWVTRGQMAVFITRMLAHTNARPAGLAVQTTDSMAFRDTTIEASITLRNKSHQPMANRAVDLFTAENPDKAFDKQGACTTAIMSGLGAGGECVIEGTDPSTDTSGNLVVDVEVGDVEGLRIWAWAGNRDDSFDEDTTDYVTIDVTTRGRPAALLVRDDLPASAGKVRMGTAVTFTFQLVDDKENPVPSQGVAFVVEVREGGRQVESTTLNKRTGPDGSAQATFFNMDPSSELGDVAFLDLDMRVGGDLDILDRTTIGIVEDDGKSRDPSLEWSDERPEPTTLELSPVREYIVASSEGRGAAAEVRATLSDQYGGPVSGEQVVFSSNDIRGVPNGARRTTGSTGIASLNYLRDSDEDFTERITGSFRRLSAGTRQYWAARVSGSSSGSGAIRVINTGADSVIVVTGSEILVVEYDANDQFKIGSVATGYSAFEEALSVGDVLEFQITGTSSGTVNVFTLTDR